MRLFFVFLLNLVFISGLIAQKATIREEFMPLKTYGFSEPDPVPNIGPIYPYFRFDGYTNQGTETSWKMIILENDYIKVFVCPDIGGKVWGAIEKSTGKEFLYFNHVVKFRDVAMRGPWTSGGLEYNFGDIGHIPTCATPVDYTTRQNSDGSVSCIVGTVDLPSATRWNIEIRVSPDKAYFETIASWFNTTSLSCTYYHWMNAAAKADGNLEFIYPGTNYIGHGGEAGDWPIEKKRKLSLYEENNFGSYKSYHVLNTYSDYFGGYWHDDDFGFGHYATYDDKPGKKLWIWGLSDQGMIWEDLLTDEDGQYIEFQAGKLFNQAASNSTYTPFKHREFSPYDSDIMHEIWFPLKETRGMVAASEHAILNIEEKGDSLTIFLSALQPIKDSCIIETEKEKNILNIDLKPLEIYTTSIKAKRDSVLIITVGENLLTYSTKEEQGLGSRPIQANKDFDWKSVYGIYVWGLELEKQRMYDEALNTYRQCLQKDPGYLPAINRLAYAYFRRMEYDTALVYCQKALSIDTYDTDANYAYGLVNKMLWNLMEAKSGFSIAAQGVSKRSAAYVELAQIFVKEGNLPKAQHYASKAIEYNTNSITAHEILAYTHRLQQNSGQAQTAIDALYALDALSDFASFEELLSNEINTSEFKDRITNELEFESYLRLALTYYQFNDEKAAMEVLKLSPQHPIVLLWLSYLQKDKGAEFLKEALKSSAHMVFPHRNETAQILEAFIKTNNSWKLKYYLGLIHWKNGLKEKTKELFIQCQDDSDYPAFYLAKAELFNEDSVVVGASLEKAHALAPQDWRSALRLSNYYLSGNKVKKAIELSGDLIHQNPEIPSLGMTYARSLLEDNQNETCLSFLKSWNILPYEGAIEGKILYTRACDKIALDALEKNHSNKAITYATKALEWPRNLGVGKPYDIDDRLENFIIASAYEQKGDDSHYTAVSSHKHADYMKENSRLILQAIALRKQDMEFEANALLENAIKKDVNNIYVQWATARFNHSQAAETLQAEIFSSEKDKGDFMYQDFKLVLELLDLL